MSIHFRALSLVAALTAVSSLSAQRGGGPRDPMQEGLPLKPTRTMTFTTNVGHWMSVDVSPDGQTLVFDLLGDIYTMPITGGKATALTRGMGFDAQPRFSPDGKKIVYTSDRDGGYNVYIMSLDKKDTTQLTTGKTNRYYSPTFTPDGKYVIVTRGQRLYIYDIHGGTGEELVRADPNAPPAGGRGGGGGGGGGEQSLRQMGAAFGKDPRYVWFAQRRGTFMYNSPLQDYSLAVYDRESGQTTTRETRWGSAFRPALSPDGNWLVYGTRHINETRLRIRDLRNGEEKWLVYPVQRDDQESAASLDVLPGMAFTPDSKFLITTWDGKLWKVAVPSGKPTEIPFSADVVQPLGPSVRFDYPIPDSATFVIKQIRDAVPSPDGKQLAFVALDRLYVMDYPNGTPRRLTKSTAGEFEPSWSPDGQWIAYATWNGTGGDIYKIRADGSGEPRKLTTVSAYWQHPKFSPNGARIVAVRGPARAFNLALAQGTPGGAEDVVWLPSNGGDAVFIAPAAGMTIPQFTDDTTRIFGYSAGRGLFSMRWDGTDVRSLLRVGTGGGRGGGGGNATVVDVQISPDGSQALASTNAADIYLLSIPWLGGTPPTINLGENSTFPNKKLTDIGGQFPVWSDDGRFAHWSIGNAHVVYDIERARAFDDSVRRANRIGAAVPGDSTGRGGGRGGRTLPQFRPAETRIRVTAERDIPKGVSVLRGARAVTMKGNEIIDNADIVVTNNRITAIGKRGSVAIPSGAHVIDVSGKTIIPGFVDTHAHLRVASDIHRDVQWSYAVNLAYGVTTARDPQTGQTDVLSYEDEVRSGNVLGPRIYSTGPGVFSYTGVRDLESARRILRRYSDYYDTKTIKEYETGNREVRQWVIQAANELHLMPTTEGGLDYPMNITEAFDGYSGHEHTIPTYPLQDDVIKLLVESGISYTPTLIVSYGAPWMENYWYEHYDVFNEAKLRRFTPWNDLAGKIFRRGGTNNPAPNGAQAGWFADNQYAANIAAADITKLVAAGARVGIGSHGQLQGLGYHWELWSIAMGGIAPHDLLRVATIIGADALGLAKDVGSLEPGKEADLLVLDKNPLENIRNTAAIRYVMKNGRLYEANTLDEVWPRQKKAGSYYWQVDEGGTSTKTP